MTRRIEIADYDPAWPAAFAALAGPLRAALGDVPVRIDHIGSTAVPGLGAKPIIDVQISVRALEPASVFAAPLTGLGWVFRRDNPDRTKRYFREAAGQPRTHVHVRQEGEHPDPHPTALDSADDFAAGDMRTPAGCRPALRGEGTEVPARLTMFTRAGGDQPFLRL